MEHRRDLENPRFVTGSSDPNAEKPQHPARARPAELRNPAPYSNTPHPEKRPASKNPDGMNHLPTTDPAPYSNTPLPEKLPTSQNPDGMNQQPTINSAPLLRRFPMIGSVFAHRATQDIEVLDVHFVTSIFYIKQPPTREMAGCS